MQFQNFIRPALICALALQLPNTLHAQAVLPRPFERLGIWAATRPPELRREAPQAPAESREDERSEVRPRAVLLADSIVALARAQVGTRYRLGGNSPDRGFDCSGLVRFVASALGLELPRTAAQQSRAGLEVIRDQSFLKPGDLLTFGRGNRVSHVGIYIGDGRFVHASSVAGRVVESRLDRPVSALVRPWTGIRRVLLASDTTAAASGG